MEKRHWLLIVLIALFWGSFPSIYTSMYNQRGGFAVGGEWLMFIFPFVIYILVDTVCDMFSEIKKD